MGGEGDVAGLLILGVEGARDDQPFVVVDVLLVGQQVAAADVDDAPDVGDLTLGLGEDLDVVVGLFDQVFLFLGVLEDAVVGGEGVDLLRLDAADEERVGEDGGSQVLKQVL